MLWMLAVQSPRKVLVLASVTPLHAAHRIKLAKPLMVILPVSAVQTVIFLETAVVMSFVLKVSKHCMHACIYSTSYDLI